MKESSGPLLITNGEGRATGVLKETNIGVVRVETKVETYNKRRHVENNSMNSNLKTEG